MLRPLLHKWEAHYFNGHEHDLEHIVEKGSAVNYICTGAGKYCCYADTNLNTVPEGSIKFSVSGPGGEDWWGRSPTAFELQSGLPRLIAPDSVSPMLAAYHIYCTTYTAKHTAGCPVTHSTQQTLPQNTRLLVRASRSQVKTVMCAGCCLPGRLHQLPDRPRLDAGECFVHVAHMDYRPT